MKFIEYLISLFKSNKISKSDKLLFDTLELALQNPDDYEGFYYNATFIVELYEIVVNPNGRFNTFHGWVTGQESKLAPKKIRKLAKQKYLEINPSGEFFKRRPVKYLEAKNI